MVKTAERRRHGAETGRVHQQDSVEQVGANPLETDERLNRRERTRQKQITFKNQMEDTWPAAHVPHAVGAPWEGVRVGKTMKHPQQGDHAP